MVFLVILLYDLESCKDGDQKMSQQGQHLLVLI